MFLSITVETPDSSCDSEAGGAQFTDVSQPDAVVQYDDQCTRADGCEPVSLIISLGNSRNHLSSLTLCFTSFSQR